MCTDRINPRTAPMNQTHINVAQAHYPGQIKLIDDVATAISQGLSPAMNVLAIFTVMADYLKAERYGLLAKFKAVRVPLSIVAGVTRYRPPIVEELHETVIPFNMARKNIDGLNLALAGHGMACFMTCSCGVVLCRTKDLKAFVDSPELQDLDLFRSSLDRAGAQVIHVSSLDDVPAKNIDLTSMEVAMLSDIDQLVESMAQVLPYGEHEANTLLQRSDIALARERLVAFAENARRFTIETIALA